MPKQTVKQIVIEHMYLDGVSSLLELSSEDEEGYDEVVSSMEWNLAMAYNQRFGDLLKVPKQKYWLNEVFPNYDEGRFHQLATTLFRLGFNGTGASIHNVARLFGVGDGATIDRVTKRVFKAILQLKNQFVYWPDEHERRKMVEQNESNLPGNIGYIDGTSINLEEAPSMDKDSYYDKNKNYSIKAQLVCDNEKRIRHFVVGYPGSVHDSRIWNECNLSKHKDDYFTKGEWIAADKGYPLLPEVITPFRENAANMSTADIHLFNKHFSSFRVKIEHVNGVLKETWGSLKEIRIRIKDNHAHEQATQWVEVCLILYNITINPSELVGNTRINYDEVVPTLSPYSEEKRSQLLQYIKQLRTE